MPLPSPETRALFALGARRARPHEPTVPEVVRTLRGFGADGGPLVALFDARGIAGERHLLSAWAHLGRARARGESRLRDRSAELALFVAGEDQLPRALAKVGVQAETEAFVLVGERPRSPDELLGAFRLVEDPSAYPRPVDEAVLDRLGVGAEDRAVVPRSGWEGLVLERVALLELSSRAGAAGPEKKP